MALSIIIPAYNEAARLGKTLHTILQYMETHAPGGELIVVDDGSRDNTAQIAGQVFNEVAPVSVQTKVIRYEANRGKGYAVRAGLLAARSPIALFSDADLSTPITETPKLIEPIKNNKCDVAFGSRALDRSLIGVHQPWQREQSGRIFNLAVKLATRMRFWDTQCGFKAFRMDVCRPIIEAAVVDRFAFDVELLYVAHMAGLRLCETPVRWDDNAGSTVSFLGGLNGFRELKILRQHAKRGIYNEALAAARVIAANSRMTAPALHSPAASSGSEPATELAGSA